MFHIGKLLSIIHISFTNLFYIFIIMFYLFHSHITDSNLLKDNHLEDITGSVISYTIYIDKM